MKPIWKVLIAAAIVAGLLFILIEVPHYRAKVAVRSYREQLKAQGEKMTIAELIPPLSAEEVNNGRELLAALGRVGYPTNPPPCMRWVAPGHALVGSLEAILPTEYTSNCWPELGETVKANQEATAAIRAALEKPALGFLVNYQQGFSAPLPHLTTMKKGSLWLSCATLVALHENDTTAAWENLKSEMDLIRKNTGGPLIICQLVRVAMTQIALSTTWEALQFPNWKDEQLAQLQEQWSSFDLLDQMEAGLSMERQMAGLAFVELRSSYKTYSSVKDNRNGSRSYNDFGQVLMNPSDGPPSYLGRRPRYWLWKWRGSYDEELFDMHISQAGLEAVRQIRTGAAIVPALNNFNNTISNLKKDHSDLERKFIFGNTLAGIPGPLLLRVADAELGRRMLVTAIALKRYRQQRGKYPMSLAELMPEYLQKAPIDFMDGKPLRYQRKDNDTFLLYSVGEDGVDNHGDGTVIQPEPFLNKSWIKGRDAVWPTPATPEQVKQYEAEVLERFGQKQGPHKLVPRLKNSRPSTPIPGQIRKAACKGSFFPLFTPDVQWPDSVVFRCA